MRIVLVGPYAPYRGGIAHFAAALRRALQTRGHEVVPITFSRQYPRTLFPGKTEFETGEMPDEPAPRELDSVNPLSWLRLARRIRSIAPDAVAYSFWMPFFAPAYGVLARRVRGGIRHVAIVHNLLPHEARPGDLPLVRFFLSRCHGALALSSAVASDLQRTVPQLQVRRAAHPIYDIFGAPPARARARAELGIPADAQVALFFGFVRRYKGLHVLLRALPAVAAALPRFRLVVAGEFYEDEATYRRLIEEHALTDRVLIHNAYIPAENVGCYFAASDVVVQPYVSATQSGVAQMALHFERPMIVSDVGGLSEVIRHGRAGLVVPPDQVGALADSIIRFFGENLATELEEGVRQEKHKYGWEPLVQAFEGLLSGDVD